MLSERTDQSARRSTERQRDVRSLLLRYCETRDPRARDALIRRYLPLARKLAWESRGRGEPVEDLVQVASVGLIKAIDRFDPRRTTSLASFATPTIVGELKRHFRDRGWAVHVPRSLKERSALIENAVELLWIELGRAPTMSEIAARTGVTPDEVVEARQAGTAYRTVPLYGSDGTDDDSPADTLGIEDRGFAIADHTATLERLMSVIAERERTVLRLRFRDELSQREIGERIGASQMQVSRLIRQSVDAMREFAEHGFQPAS
jgi:RNA polymerase sigma-B factor